MPKSVVTNPYFDWRDDRRPRTPWHETIVYEVHVKGFTARHPDIAPELRGTYAGARLAADHRAPEALGVTAVELLPVHQFVAFANPRIEGTTQLLGLRFNRIFRAA